MSIQIQSTLAAVAETGRTQRQATERGPGMLRSSLRHVLDQFRLQQSANVDLEFYEAGSPDAPKGRLGRDQGAHL